MISAADTPAAHRNTIKTARKNAKKGRPPKKGTAAAGPPMKRPAAAPKRAKQSVSDIALGWNGNTFRLGDVWVQRKVERKSQPFYQIKNYQTKGTLLQASMNPQSITKLI